MTVTNPKYYKYPIYSIGDVINYENDEYRIYGIETKYWNNGGILIIYDIVTNVYCYPYYRRVKQQDIPGPFNDMINEFIQ